VSILDPPGSPKPTKYIPNEGKLALNIIDILVKMVEVEGILLPMPKPRLGPPLKTYSFVGIETDGMGVGMIGILMEGKEDTTNIPQMETLVETGMDSVGPMTLRDDKVDIVGMPTVTLVDELEG
jgi:hypothetical protein